MEPFADVALWTGLLVLLSERVTRIIMDRKASRRNNSTSTGSSNPGHSVAGQLASLATIAASVQATAVRVETTVKENREENTAAHATIHSRIDSLARDVVALQITCGRLEERVDR